MDFLISEINTETGRWSLWAQLMAFPFITASPERTEINLRKLRDEDVNSFSK